MARIARRLAATLAACGFAAPPAAADDLSFLKGSNSPVGTAAAPVETIVHDLDGDGAPDVVVRNFDDFRIWWGRTDGTGFLDPGPVVTATNNAVSLEVVNVDGDSDVDIVAAGNQLQVFKQTAVRTFTSFGAPIEPDGGGGPTTHGFEGIDSGQLDGDPANELAVTVQRRESGFELGHVRVLDNDGGGTFSYDATYSDPQDLWVGELVVGRFDNTGGGMDIAYRWSDFSGDYGVRVLRDNAAGTLAYNATPITTLNVGQEFVYTFGFLDVADVDLDGRDDLLAQGSAQVAWGSDSGTFTLQTVYAGDDVSRVFAAQMAGDAKLEVVATGANLRVFTHGAAARTFTTGINLVVPSEFGFVAGDSGDFDADPRDDLVVQFDTNDSDFDDDLWVLLTRDPGNPSPFPAAPSGNGGTTNGGTGGGGGPGPTFEPPPPPPPTPIPPPPDITQPVVPVVASQIARLPSNRRCVSRRNFRIRLRRPPEGVTVREARVFVNGRRVRVVRGARLTAPVDLRGLPKGRVVVTIRIVLSDGRVLRGRRAYRTCATKKRKGRFGRRRARRG